MRTHVLISAGLFLVSSCAELGGTASQSTDEPVAVATFNLELENGGLDTTPESPEFEELENAVGLDALALEEDVAEPEIDAALADLGPVRRFELRLLWGHRPEGKPDTSRVWDGSVSTTVGGLRVIRAIRFEADTDSLEARVDASAVAFTSTTYGHVDGLRLRLVIPEAEADGELVIALAGLPELRIPHARLAHLVRARKVDELGNGLSIIAFEDTGCVRGAVAGRWEKTQARGGVFGGAVEGREGHKVGKLVGIWGVRKGGERRFFGRFVRDGEPVGIARGTWTKLPHGDGGLFRGQVIGGGGAVLGHLVGHFRTATEPGPVAMEDDAAEATPEDAQGSFQAIFFGSDDSGLCAPPGAPSPSGEPPSPDLCTADASCVVPPVADCNGLDCDLSTME
ncbi:MAG: hypothetical protein IV100_28990 [Myxococcales bacterium]|nr:hypothetical protein [Myxococcales bacterium]